MSRRPGGAIDQISQLRGVTWDWRVSAPARARSRPGMGVIAQEVEDVFPDLVETDERGWKTVRYAGLVPPLMGAVAELHERLSALEGRVGNA